MLRNLTNTLTKLLGRRPSVNIPEISPTIINPSPQTPSLPSSPSSANEETREFTQNIIQRRSSTANLFNQFSAKPELSPPKSLHSNTNQSTSIENFVRVRIWSSKTKEGAETYAANAILQSGNVGHATLETKNIYASFWPERGVSSPKELVNSEYVSSPQIDIRRESIGRSQAQAPDYVFDFYSLDVKSIEQAFKQMKDSKESILWTLFGNSLNEKGHSCSSLTLALLEKGGLNNLASSKIRGIIAPTSNLIASPNNLINQLSYAQKVEKLLHPEIIELKELPKDKPPAKDSLIVSIKAGVAKIVKQENIEQPKDTAQTENLITPRR